MSDTVKHSDDEEIVTLTYTWGQVKNFLHEHGRPATTRNAEALVAACGRGNRIENGMDSLFNGAYDEVEGQLYEALTDDLPDKPWYDRPNGKWVYDREEPADHHDEGEDEPWLWHVLPCRRTFEREPMLVLQHLLPVRKAHVRIMHRPLRHVRQHRLRRRRVRNPGRRMGVRRMRTETRPGEKNGCSTPSKTMRARNNTRRPKPSTASSAASSTASKQDRGHGEKPIEENDLRALLRAIRPSVHWCEKSTACPHPRKNMETVEKQQAKTSRKYHNTVI